MCYIGSIVWLNKPCLAYAFGAALFLPWPLPVRQAMVMWPPTWCLFFLATKGVKFKSSSLDDEDKTLNDLFFFLIFSLGRF